MGFFYKKDSFAFACHLTFFFCLIKIDIDGLGDLKLIYGIRVLGTTFRARRDDKVISLSFNI